MEIDGEKAKELLEQLLREKVGKREKVRLDDLEERYLREHGKLAPATVKYYKWTFAKIKEKREYWFEDASEVNEYIGGLNVGDESARVMFGFIRAIGRYTKRVYGWYDPTEMADRPSVKHKTRRYFKNDDMVKIIGACKNGEEKVLVAALLDSTCRIKELAGLKVENLGIDGFKTFGKTGERWYRCDARLIEIMRNMAVDGVVFPVKDDCRKVVRPAVCCRPNVLADRVRHIFKRAGLTGEKLGPHTLRHTGASLVAKSTRSALAVKALLQQDDIKSSMRYIHDAEEDIQREVSPMSMAGLKVLEDKQIELGEHRMLAIPSFEKMSDLDMINSMMPTIKGGIKVRPSINSEELEMIKNALARVMLDRGETGSGCKEVQFMRRIVRRS